jgi:CubicO group peptidase (beta-lactamase class C family)
MTELEQIAPPGARVSYSQAGYNLVGRIIEKVTGRTFEQAVASLVFEPLGLSHSFFARDDIMTWRFAARLWRRSRGDNPGGGIASSVADQLRWARFHLGDGHAESGARVLRANVLHQMKEPTADLRASNLGDAIGIGWFLRDVDGVRAIGHGGSANGQSAPDHAPFDFGLLPGDRDEYIITSGAFKGQRGLFTRNESGAVVGVDLAGR